MDIEYYTLHYLDSKIATLEMKNVLFELKFTLFLFEIHTFIIKEGALLGFKISKKK